MTNSRWMAFLLRLFLLPALLALIGGTVSGCGLKGDLYLEEEPAEAAEAATEPNENAAAD